MLEVIDISRHNGGMDFKITKAKGVYSVIMRSSVGTYYIDPKFAYNLPRARDAGIEKVGMYHVITPEESWQKQVDIVLELKEKNPVDYIVLDCELDRGQDERVITSKIQKWVQAIGKATYVNPMIYTRMTWWDLYVLPWSKWALYPLIVANYTSGAQPCMPRDWKKWLMWQWSANGNGMGDDYGSYDDGTGFGKDMDLDKLDCTKEDFEQYCLGAVPVPPIPVPITFPRLAITTVGLRVRTGPSTNSKSLRILPAGTQVQVYSEVNKGAELWVKISKGSMEYCAMLYNGNVYMKYI